MATTRFVFGIVLLLAVSVLCFVFRKENRK